VPVVGGFDGRRGEFCAADAEDGRRIKVRFIYDNRTWETNWTADFERADPARACQNGQPRR
jgi:hypothetical protein